MGKKGTKKPLVQDGKSRPRKLAPGPLSWTAAKERKLIEALGETCNVKLSAEIAGVSTSGIYERRKRDAKFRSAWDQALATGYAQLEMMMLERALHGVEKIVVTPSGESKAMREYSDRVGLALLRMHRDTARVADEDPEPGEIDEALQRIVARLERMADGTVETKAARGRAGLIAAAFRLGRARRR